MIPGPLTKLVATPQNTYQPLQPINQRASGCREDIKKDDFLQKYHHFKDFLPVLLKH